MRQKYFGHFRISKISPLAARVSQIAKFLENREHLEFIFDLIFDLMEHNNRIRIRMG